MKLIVGLGNPGRKYEKTRHNVGFIVIDSFAEKNKWRKEKNYLITDIMVNNEKIILIKPQTFMNLSGSSVQTVSSFYNIKPEDILVIHDDLDLPSGKYRIKISKSSGGHNGIKDIIKCLGNSDFVNLKIGIGSSDIIDTIDYVLGKLSKDEIKFLNSSLFHEIIEYFIINGLEKTMNKYNGN